MHLVHSVHTKHTSRVFCKYDLSFSQSLAIKINPASCIGQAIYEYLVNITELLCSHQNGYYNKM